MSLHDFERVQEQLKGLADPITFLINLFAHAPTGFGVWTADGHPLLTNKAFMDLFHVEPPPEYNVLKDDQLAATGMLPLFRRAFAGETVHIPTLWYDPREQNVVHVTEGRRVAVSMTLFPLFKKDGSLDYVVGMYKDETEVMLAQERLREANENLERTVELRTAELRAINRELESFSSSAAHDLQGPLQAMNLFAQILLDDHADKIDVDARRHLHTIKNNAKTMGKLVNALLSLARVSQSELHPESVDLAIVAHSVSTELAAQEAARPVELVVAGSLDTTMDPVLARSLIDNLLGNAWKFTRNTPSARIEVGSTDVDGARAFYVRDNGVGFDMARAGKLFTAFERLHSPVEFAGTGIGLATCHRIVERHGGRIWAESQPSAGATIYFTLP